jgi:hypothetical protein
MRIVPYFLLTGMGLETHDIYAMGYTKPTMRNLSISALMVQLWMRVEEVVFDT